MKRNVLSVLLTSLILAGVPATEALGQSTFFTYQGRLSSGTNAADGIFDLNFSLFSVSSGPGQVGSTYPAPATPVSNGLFTVVLDFGANFPGADRWLEIAVRTNGGGSFTLLAPRQPITSTPYAIQAANAGSLGGQPPTAYAPVSGSTAYVAKAGDTMTGNLYLPGSDILGFGNIERQMINLWNAGYGIGVQDFTLYERSGSGFAWYAGGAHTNTQNNPGGGTTLMTLDSFGDLAVTALSANGPVSGTSSGNRFSTGILGANTGDGSGVFGTSSGTGPGISGDNTGGGEAGHFHGDVGITGALSAGGRVSGEGSGVPFSTGVFGNDTSGLVNSSGMSGFSTGGKGVYGTSSGDSSLSAGVWGENTSVGGTALVGRATGANSTGLYAFGTGWAGYFDGKVSVCTLTIRGGCDVAEPFQMSSKAIPKGSVVVIDDENAGQLKLSQCGYDHRVAGIVSGANGINPGIALHQDGALEGGQNVALSGRVYVLAEASSSPIKPGDLLTTSDTPGLAMKVIDHAKAQGAIIGKAMSALPEGKGMVLVLVTLQ